MRADSTHKPARTHMEHEEEFNEGEGFDGGEDEGGEGAEFEFGAVDEDMQALESSLRTTKDGLVFAVDCRENMFVKNSRGKTPWSVALSIASRVLRRKIIVQGKTQCSILFWGTREKLNENSFDHVYEFMTFDLPSAGKISQLDSLLSGDDTKMFEEKIGSLQDPTQTSSAFERMLWLCSSHFTSNKFTSRDEQRIWIFTNDQDLGQADKIAVRVEDLHKANASLTLWTMTDKKRDFDLHRYWNQVLKLEDEDEEEQGVVWVAEEADLNEVLDLTRKREFAKRTLVSIPLILGPNVEIGVRLYAIVLETKLPYSVALEERTGKPVKISTRWLCTSHAQHVSADQIMTTAKYGPLGSIPFSNEEKKRIKRFAPASLTVLGFKPLSELKLWQNVRAPYLVRADDKRVKNSTKALLALVSEVLQQGKFAVARMISNRSAAPKLVALLPQAEQLDQDGELVTPLGFLVVVLPYADDIREPYFPDEMKRATNDQIEKAKMVINRLTNTRPFNPREYENPALQKFWHGLEALALDQRDNAKQWKESEHDLLRLPNEEELVFDTEFVDAAEAFSASYGGAGEIEAAAAKRKPATKRKPAAAAADDGDEEKPKKRTVTAAGEYDDYDWPSLAVGDGLAKLKNDELKVYLMHHGLPKTGTKAAMVDRITQHLAAE